MSSGPSRKEQRRQAALRERDRRSREWEAANLEQGVDVDWGAASLLPETVRTNILRLGGLPRSPRSRDPIEILTREIEWPTGHFRTSTSLFRQLASDLALDDGDETELQDAMPVRCFDFQFLNDRADDGREVSYDATSCFPIGHDCHALFFIARNPTRPEDPWLYRLDRDSMDEKPNHPEDATMGWLLSVLATA